jgi:hypothetical protein
LVLKLVVCGLILLIYICLYILIYIYIYIYIYTYILCGHILLGQLLRLVFDMLGREKPEAVPMCYAEDTCEESLM